MVELAKVFEGLVKIIPESRLESVFKSYVPDRNPRTFFTRLYLGDKVLVFNRSLGEKLFFGEVVYCSRRDVSFSIPTHYEILVLDSYFLHFEVGKKFTFPRSQLLFQKDVDGFSSQDLSLPKSFESFKKGTKVLPKSFLKSFLIKPGQILESPVLDSFTKTWKMQIYFKKESIWVSCKDWIPII